MNPFPTINCLAFVAYSGARIVNESWYVTGQPSTPAYAAIAAAGIKAVVCVRQPGEPVAPPPVAPVPTTPAPPKTATPPPGPSPMFDPQFDTQKEHGS